MMDGYGLIAVLSEHEPKVEKTLLNYTYEKESAFGATYFIVEEIEWSCIDDTTSGGLGGALATMNEDDYALAMTHGTNPSIIMHGNPERFGIKGILAYGNERQSSTH